MQYKSRKDKNGETVADKTLKKYIAFISDEVYKQYGLGKGTSNLSDTESKKTAWTTLHSWDESKERFVIERSKLFLRLLDSTDSNSTNLQFIKALVNRIASYLSEFCQHGPKRSKNHAKNILVDMLYTKNPYIRGLELYQLERRENSRPRTKKTVTNKKKQDRINAERKRRDMEHQVHVMFVEVASYRKK